MYAAYQGWIKWLYLMLKFVIWESGHVTLRLPSDTETLHFSWRSRRGVCKLSFCRSVRMCVTYWGASFAAPFYSRVQGSVPEFSKCQNEIFASPLLPVLFLLAAVFLELWRRLPSLNSTERAALKAARRITVNLHRRNSMLRCCFPEIRGPSWCGDNPLVRGCRQETVLILFHCTGRAHLPE